MLGTNTGSVHRQRQGTGLATVLKGDMAVEDFIRLDDEEGKAQRAAAQARKAAGDAAMKDILAFNPERWVKHDVEIRGGLNRWVDSGARLLQKGINPSTGLDPESIAWRAEKAKIENDARYSMQVKEMHEKTKAKLDGAEAGKYTPDTLEDVRVFFETPLRAIRENGYLIPPLIQAKPGANLQKTWAGLTKDLYDRNGNKPLDEAGKWDFVTASMSNDPEVVEATESYLFNLPKAEQDRYKERAQKTGKSVMELVNRDFLDMYSPGKEPFDLDKYIQTGADSIKVPYAEWSTPLKSGLAPDKKELSKIAATKAQTMLVNPEALYGYQSLLPMKDGEAEGDYRARATADLTKRLQDLKETKTSSGLTSEGQGRQERKVSEDRWLEHIKSSDKNKNIRAAQYLFETKGVLGDMNVSGAYVDDQPWNVLAPKSLIIDLEGAPDLKEVEATFNQATGLKSGDAEFKTVGTNAAKSGEIKPTKKSGDAEFKTVGTNAAKSGEIKPTKKSGDVEFKTVGTKSQIIIPINDNTENALLRVHDKAFKTGDRPYDAEPLGWSADDILKQAKPSPGTTTKKSQY